MYRYLIVESKAPIHADASVIIGMFQDVLHINEIQTDDYLITMIYDHETDISFEDIILNMMSDTLSVLRVYASHTFDDRMSLDAHRLFILNKLKLVPFFKYAYLDDSIILRTLIHQIDKETKHMMLRKFYDDQVMYETIRTYLESNQNMSLAAKKLYLHRNTLIQRIDKFAHVTGFDVRIFTHAYLIYQMIS